MTISTNDTPTNKAKFEANYEAIFGKNKPVSRGSFVQDPETGKLVPKGKYERPSVNAPMVMNVMKEFKSPIDGSIISSRSKLAAHNKRHGVTNASDYSGGYIEKKATERVNSGQKYLKDTRRTDINSAFNQHR